MTFSEPTPMSAITLRFLWNPPGIGSPVNQKWGANGNQVVMEAAGISITASAKVKVTAAQVEVSAGMVKVDAAIADFSGIVKCAVLQTFVVANLQGVAIGDGPVGIQPGTPSGWKCGVQNTPRKTDVPVGVHHWHTGAYSHQVFRLHAGDPQLHDACIGIAIHGHFAVGPGALSQPVHRKCTVLCLLQVKQLPAVARAR